jgi:hypothetical protein
MINVYKNMIALTILFKIKKNRREMLNHLHFIGIKCITILYNLFQNFQQKQNQIPPNPIDDLLTRTINCAAMMSNIRLSKKQK